MLQGLTGENLRRFLMLHMRKVLLKYLNTIAVGMLTLIPSVYAAAKVITVIVIAAPSILIVEPSGMDTE